MHNTKIDIKQKYDNKQNMQELIKEVIEKCKVQKIAGKTISRLLIK